MLGKFSRNSQNFNAYDSKTQIDDIMETEVYCTKPIDLELKVLSHGKIKKKCSFGSPYFPSRMAPLKYNYSEEET